MTNPFLHSGVGEGLQGSENMVQGSSCRVQGRAALFVAGTLSGPNTQSLQPCLTQSVFILVSQKSIPTQIRQLVLYLSNSKGAVDGYVELTSVKRLPEDFV